jgi:hypothetical protein
VAPREARVEEQDLLWRHRSARFSVEEVARRSP